MPREARTLDWPSRSVPHRLPPHTGRSFLRPAHRPCFELPALFFPQGFLTGVLQVHARKHGLAIDGLRFTFEVRAEMEAEEVEAPPHRVEEGKAPLACPHLDRGHQYARQPSQSRPFCHVRHRRHPLTAYSAVASYWTARRGTGPRVS